MAYLHTPIDKYIFLYTYTNLYLMEKGQPFKEAMDLFVYAKF